ncbi:MAG: hydrogenase subunit MbhD domain-containing protein [Oscillospiraceae bacterium]
MILRIIIDLLIAVSLYFAIAGTIGINKMPDTFSRMQASTLITTLGVLGANIGAILYAIFIMHNGAAAVKIAVIAALVVAVNPIGAHAIARALTALASDRSARWKWTILGGTSMSELVVILNALILLGVVVSAILAVHCEKLLSSVIALGVTGIFAAAEFLLLHAPDVAISEAAVGAALTPLIFIVTIKKLKGGDDK